MLTRSSRPDSEIFGDAGLLTPHEFDQIRQLARRTFGLDLRPGKEELVSSRLRRILRNGGFRSFQEYYHHVVTEPTGTALAGMVDALTTNHTSFFREPDHFEFLKREVVPRLATRNSIDIWCAACATGEEVWTLAMVLDHAFGQRRIQIHATDISNKALQCAREGTYLKERLTTVPNEWISRYFLPEELARPAYRVSPQIRSLATFRRLNLMDPFPWSCRFPVIFCRNVMIYFDSETQQEVVRRLADCLEPGGYLFIGHAESLTRIRHPLEFIKPAVYRKPGGSLTCRKS